MITNASRALANASRCHPSAHFKIHHDMRDPTSHGATHRHGVRNQQLIETYAGAMDAAWNELQATPMPFDVGIGSEPLRCLVTDLHQVFPGSPSPFCRAEIEGDEIIPFIALPSCYRELVDWPSILDMARCAARHEPAHAWAFRVWSKLWAGLTVDDVEQSIALLLKHTSWLTEGHAVAVEAGDARDGFWLQHAWVWCDRPECSLFREPYASGLFARYLDRRMGWRPGETFSRAITAITNPPKLEVGLAGVIGPLEEANARKMAMITSWAALDQVLRPHLTAEQAWMESCRAGAYIGGSTLPADEEPAVFARYGRRAVSQSLSLRPGGSIQTDAYPAESLSCRYFQLDLDPAVKRIRVVTPSDRPHGAAILRVGLWSETDARTGHWFVNPQEEWIIPAIAGESRGTTRWFLVCALVPFEGGHLEGTKDPSWLLKIEAR